MESKEFRETIACPDLWRLLLSCLVLDKELYQDKWEYADHLLFDLEKRKN